MYWVDGSNNVMTPIDYKDENIDGVRVFNVNELRLRYRLVPVFPPEDIILNMLGNLEAVKSAAKDGKNPEAIAIMNKYGDALNQVDFGEWRQFLYPEYAKFWDENPEMKEERARIEGQ